ncbi:MAG TPA: Rieske (2Fe-2S) protein [Bryobacteraceae bacterium]|nr:Rieske (2Fe-2S) protein [Bryobacteraceae bacterium]
MNSFDKPAGRRTVLKAGLGLGIQLGLGASAEGQDDAAAVRPKVGDWLVRVGDASATPLTPAEVPVGGKQIMAWAMDPSDRTVRNGSRLNRVLLLRFDPEKLSAVTKSRAAEGVVAYTAICTHTGCEVTEWIAAEQILFCPCHASKFEPKDGGKVVDGPAPRDLPALPLKVTDGKLAVAKPFTARVAFEPE